MTVETIRINFAGLVPARRRLDRLSRARTSRLLDIIGSEVESQTRRRISEEKTAPDGAAWAPWSTSYAASRSPKGSMLELEGHLRDSISYEVTQDAIIIGSNLAYAAVHQEGSVYGPLRKGQGRIPERPYLGVSDANLDDIGDVVMTWLAKEFGA